MQLPTYTDVQAPDQSPATAIGTLSDQARSVEPDRYLAALLAPADAQPGLLALAAFQAEIARVPATVSDPMIGEIRLQWWRDTIAKVAKAEVSGHPVADAFGMAIRKHRLDLTMLHRLIDARGFDLTGDFYADDATLAIAYADREGIAFSLASQVLAGVPLPTDLAADAGLAYGLARSLGRLPERLHNGGFPVPETLLAEHGVTPGMLAERPFAAATVAGVDDAIASLEHQAQAALAKVRMRLPELRPAQLWALSPLVMVEPYFRAQRRRGFRRLEQMAEVLPIVRVWRLGKARLRGRL